MNFLCFVYNSIHPTGRRQKLVVKNWDEQTKLYKRNTELKNEFGVEAFSLDEHILNKQRIEELELEIKKLEDSGGYYYND